jgi:hypothetical protein
LAEVPGAAQVTLNRYRAWYAEVVAFTERVEAGDLSGDYGKSLNKLEFTCQHIRRIMLKPEAFTDGWMRWVAKRVRGWPDWNGDFSRFLFVPEAEHFQTIGTGWFSARGGRKGWERFLEQMRNESINES